MILNNYNTIKDINERQIYILKFIFDDPKFSFTIKEMQNRFDTAYETARKDIIYLEKLGLLDKTTSGKKKLVYFRSQQFDDVLRELMG